MKGKTIKLTDKELFYCERLKAIGINPSHYFRLAFRDRINKDYKQIEIEYKKTLTKEKAPF
jgi:hypothetical protein